jgi:hypothetical protein
VSSKRFRLRMFEPAERVTQRSLVEVLRKFAAPDCLWLHIANERRARDSERINQWRMGLRAGAADMLFVHRGKALFQELKRSDGTQSDSQIEFAELATLAGADYEIPRSLDEAIASLHARGIIPRDLLGAGA